MTPLYIGLGLLALILQIRMYKSLFDVKGVNALRHFLVSAVILSLMASGLGAAASIPLRALFE